MVFTTDSAKFLHTRLDSRETFTTESFSDGTTTIISGSSTSTGSFGVLKLDGGEFTSASLKIWWNLMMVIVGY